MVLKTPGNIANSFLPKIRYIAFLQSGDVLTCFHPIRKTGTHRLVVNKQQQNTYMYINVYFDIDFIFKYSIHFSIIISYNNSLWCFLKFLISNPLYNDLIMKDTLKSWKYIWMSFTGHFLSDVYSYLVTFYIWLLLISGYQTYLVIIDIWLLVISGYQTYLVISNIWLLDISGY